MEGRGARDRTGVFDGLTLHNTPPVRTLEIEEEIKAQCINPTLWAMNQESHHYSLAQQLHSQPETMWQKKIFVSITCHSLKIKISQTHRGVKFRTSPVQNKNNCTDVS